MRRLAPLAAALAVAACGLGAPPPPPAAAPAPGSLVFDTVPARALEGNPGGASPLREVAVYLPPGYAAHPARRYPVVYLLHGFDGDARQFLAPPFSLVAALDSLIAAGAIRPMIVAMPDLKDRVGGAFAVNSPATGRWEDFAADDLPAHLDAAYRTVARAEGRGVAGWSMGGYGALSLAMRRPDRFGVAYALSPCCLGPELLDDLGPPHPAWAELRSPRDPAELGFHARLLVAVASVLSPDPASPPLRVDLPFAPSGAAWEPAEPAHSRWRAATVEARVGRHADALRALRGLGVDAGDRDGFTHIPATVRRLSAALRAAGIPHRSELYPGTHGSGVPERLRRVVLPFLSERLEGGA